MNTIRFKSNKPKPETGMELGVTFKFAPDLAPEMAAGKLIEFFEIVNGGIIDQATVCSEHLIDGEPTFIADTVTIDDEVPLSQRRANAFLVAAAPFMQQALTEITSECEAGPHQALRQIVAKKARAAWKASLTAGQRGEP